MCPEPSIKVDGIAGESGVSTTMLDIETSGDEIKGSFTCSRLESSLQCKMFASFD